MATHTFCVFRFNSLKNSFLKSCLFSKGLYFDTLRYFVIVCFLAGVINIPNLFFLWSDAEGNYASPDARSGTRNEAAFTVRSSLICTNTLWMPCPTCTSETNYKAFVEADRYALDENGSYYILTNGCELNRLFGYTTFASLVFVLLAMYNFMRIQSHRTKEIDWSEQTSSDYSIQITVSKVKVRRRTTCTCTTRYW
jgi:hypothetical protein